MHMHFSQSRPKYVFFESVWSYRPEIIHPLPVFCSITGLRDENQIPLENQEPVNVSVRIHCSNFRRKARILQLTVLALYFFSNEGIIIYITHLS